MNITRYDLTEDVNTGVLDITPVPDSHEGRYVSYSDYLALEDAYAELQERYDLDVNPECK